MVVNKKSYYKFIFRNKGSKILKKQAITNKKLLNFIPILVFSYTLRN